MIEYRIRQTKDGYTVQPCIEGHPTTNPIPETNPQKLYDIFVKGDVLLSFVNFKTAPRKLELEELIEDAQRRGYRVKKIFK